MSDIGNTHSPLDSLLTPGVSPSPGNTSGLSIQERRDVVQLQLIARNNRVAQAAEALAEFLGQQTALQPLEGAAKNGLSIFATGPREYWILAEGISAAQATTDVINITGQSASIFDQSDARIVIRLAGLNALNVLAKGTALDLGEDAFPQPGAAHTALNHIPAIIARHSVPSCFDVAIPRSYAASFMTWLRDAAREYGYP